MKNISRIGQLWIAVFFCCTASLDAIANDTATEAAAYFQQKQFKEALSIWNEMNEAGNTSAGLYYNIGIAESQLNNTPGAMLAFEKAFRLKPGNHLIKNAIKQERKKMENPTIPVEPFFILEWYKRFLMLLRPGYWAFLGMGLLLFGVIRFLRKVKRVPGVHAMKRQWPVILVTAGLLAVVIGLFSYREIYRENEAIVNASSEVRQAPADESPLVRLIEPGEKVMITDQIGEWCNVNLLNLDAGWVKKQNLVLIRIGDK